MKKSFDVEKQIKQFIKKHSRLKSLMKSLDTSHTKHLHLRYKKAK